MLFRSVDDPTPTDVNPAQNYESDEIDPFANPTPSTSAGGPAEFDLASNVFDNKRVPKRKKDSDANSSSQSKKPKIDVPETSVKTKVAGSSGEEPSEKKEKKKKYTDKRAEEPLSSSSEDFVPPKKIHKQKQPEPKKDDKQKTAYEITV